MRFRIFFASLRDRFCRAIPDRLFYNVFFKNLAVSSQFYHEAKEMFYKDLYPMMTFRFWDFAAFRLFWNSVGIRHPMFNGRLSLAITVGFGEEYCQVATQNFRHVLSAVAAHIGESARTWAEIEAFKKLIGQELHGGDLWTAADEIQRHSISKDGWQVDVRYGWTRASHGDSYQRPRSFHHIHLDGAIGRLGLC
jgi:hypothetical protein